MDYLDGYFTSEADVKSKINEMPDNLKKIRALLPYWIGLFLLEGMCIQVFA